jgi:hypothetical protein
MEFSSLFFSKYWGEKTAFFMLFVIIICEFAIPIYKLRAQLRSDSDGMGLLPTNILIIPDRPMV